VADSVVFAFSQDSLATSSARVEYAIIDPDDANPRTPYYYTGSSWTTTETWISSAYTATNAQTRAYFEAREADGHPLQFRIRPETMGENEDIYIDKVFCTATARAGVGVLFAAAGDSVIFDLLHPGRFTAIDNGGSTVVNFAALQ